MASSYSEIMQNDMEAKITLLFSALVRNQHEEYRQRLDICIDSEALSQDYVIQLLGNLLIKLIKAGNLAAAGLFLSDCSFADRKAILNYRDGDLQTAMHHAVLGRHPGVIILLAHNGAKVNVPDRLNNLPLDYACANFTMAHITSLDTLRALLLLHAGLCFDFTPYPRCDDFIRNMRGICLFRSSFPEYPNAFFTLDDVTQDDLLEVELFDVEICLWTQLEKRCGELKLAIQHGDEFARISRRLFAFPTLKELAGQVVTRIEISCEGLLLRRIRNLDLITNQVYVAIRKFSRNRKIMGALRIGIPLVVGLGLGVSLFYYSLQYIQIQPAWGLGTILVSGFGTMGNVVHFATCQKPSYTQHGVVVEEIALEELVNDLRTILGKEVHSGYPNSQDILTQFDEVKDLGQLRSWLEVVRDRYQQTLDQIQRGCDMSECQFEDVALLEIPNDDVIVAMPAAVAPVADLADQEWQEMEIDEAVVELDSLDLEGEVLPSSSLT